MQTNINTSRTATPPADPKTPASPPTTLSRGGEFVIRAQLRALAIHTSAEHAPASPASVQSRAAGKLARTRLQLARALEYAALLLPIERELLCALAEQGFSITAVARLSGRTVPFIRRMLQGVAARTGSPLFVFVAKTHKAMPPTMRAVAGAVILRGGSLRAAAAELGLTLWAVRQQRDKVLTRFVHRTDAP